MLDFHHCEIDYATSGPHYTKHFVNGSKRGSCGDILVTMIEFDAITQSSIHEFDANHYC